MFSPQYAEIRHLRSTGQRPSALEKLKSHAPVTDEDAFEAVVCLFQLGDFNNLVHLCATRPWQVDWPRHMGHALVQLLTHDNPGQALNHARQAVAAPDANHDAHAFF
jgi:hypothetical protein